MARTAIGSEEKVKHLEMIEAVVARLGQNSFAIKGWAVTLVSAVLALSASQAGRGHLLIALVPILMFWGLDAFYLRQERLFRRLYDAVRVLRPDELQNNPFSMDTSPFSAPAFPETMAEKEKKVPGWWSTCFSHSIGWLYGAMVVIVLLFVSLSNKPWEGQIQMPTKKRVFVSFDFDNDKVLKDFIVGQSKLPDSPFEVADWSMKEAAPQRTWKDEAKDRITRSDIVIVMVGPKTHGAPGVLAEVDMARTAGIKIVQVIGYRDANPTAVPNAGTLYRWNWDNLKKLLA